ncbi:ribonuclease HI family protein [Chloroflexota bacterium]
MQITKVVIFTDGVAEPNPGRAGIGAVIKDEHGKTVISISESIGYGTNNQAEYRAVIVALEKAIDMGIRQVDLRSDSELLVNQINGKYRVKNAALKPLYQTVQELRSRLKGFSATHIPRELNKEADKLAAKSLK